KSQERLADTVGTFLFIFALCVQIAVLADITVAAGRARGESTSINIDDGHALRRRSDGWGNGLANHLYLFRAQCLTADWFDRDAGCNLLFGVETRRHIDVIQDRGPLNSAHLADDFGQFVLHGDLLHFFAFLAIDEHAAIE